MFVTNRFKNRLFYSGLAVVLVLIFWMACTQKNPIDPVSSTRTDVPNLINISSTLSQIAVDGGQTEIRVQLVNKNGTAMPNELILFTTTMGTITSQDSTDAQGWASAILVSGAQSGTATVTAKYGENTTLSLTVKVVTASSPHFQLDLEPAVLLANGIDVSTVTVTVLDDSANPVVGVEVEFEASHGTLSEESQMTNGSGQAQVTLTSHASYYDSVGTVYAYYDTLDGAKTVTFLGVYLTMDASPDEILADGESTSDITVILKETTTQIAVSGAVIYFSATRGLIPNSESTDNRGLAKVLLTSSAVDTGVSTIIGRYGHTISDTVEVHMTAETPGNFILKKIAAIPTVILANGIAQSTITAQVVDEGQFPVAGIFVSFSASSGSIPSQAVTGNDGIATVLLTSVASQTDISSRVRVQMGGQSDSVQVDFHGVQMQVGADPTEILADGISTSHITVILKQTTNQVAISGGSLTFGTDLGLIANEATTNTSGVAEVLLTSSAGDTGTAHVTVSYGAFLRDTIDVVFSMEAPSSHTLESVAVDPEVLFANGLDESKVTAKVVNDEFAAVQGAVVLFSASGGSIPAQGITGEDGIARVSLISDTSHTDMTAWVYAQLGTQIDSASVRYLGIESQVMAFPTTITADGVSTSDIQIVLKQTTNKVAISGALLSFGADQGTIPASASTDNSGVAEVQLTSGVTPATAHVTVRYGEMILDTVEVVFEASIATNLEVSGIPLTITADGQSKSTITAVVSDDNGAPVHGVNVDFENVLLDGVSKGTLSPLSAQTNVSGVVNSIITSGTSPGNVRIYARTNGLEDSVDVEFRVGDIDHIDVAANMAILPADGITQATITASVLDAYDNPLENVIVTFLASIGDVTPSATTDANGLVTAKFSSGTVGYATISATSGGVSGQTVIQLIPGPPSSIVLSFNPAYIGVYGTGQNQTTHVIAEVRDNKNNAVLDSTLVTFSIVHGPGGGEFLSSYDPTPTVGGISRVSLSSGTVSGNVRVRAEVSDSSGFKLAEGSDIIIHAGPPYMEDRTDYTTTHLTLVATKLNIWMGLGTADLSISVFDKYHNPVQAGTAVYLTASGGGVSTHNAQTDAYGKANEIFTGANPQPTISNYYHGELMQDPNNPSIILPGPVYYTTLGEWLLPDFEGGLVENSMQDSISTCPRYGNLDPFYVNLENDGIARIIAYTEGRDAAGDSIRSWDQISIVCSGVVSYDDDSDSTLMGNTLHIGESQQVIFSLMDARGNPIEAGSDITASVFPDEAPAALSWEQINTGDGWGTVYYSITIVNDIDPEKPKPGAAGIRIEWRGDHQFGSASTHTVFMDL